MEVLSYHHIGQMVEFVIEGELILPDIWNESLSDYHSPYYSQLRQLLQTQMSETFCKDNQKDTCNIEITGFTEGKTRENSIK